MTGLIAAIFGLVTVLTALTLVWIISVKLRDASIVDICWGLGFVLLAWLYCLLSPTLTPRSWLVAALMTLWGTRLSVHIFRRHHGRGEDPRYQAIRASRGPTFWRRSLFTVFWLQGAILWFVALPLLARCALHRRRPSPQSMDSESCCSRSGSASRSSATINSSASEPSPEAAAECSIAGCGVTRGIRTTSETPRCGGAWHSLRRRFDSVAKRRVAPDHRQLSR